MQQTGGSHCKNTRARAEIQDAPRVPPGDTLQGANAPACRTMFPGSEGKAGIQGQGKTSGRRRDAEMGAAYREASTNELLRKRSIGSSQPALRFGRHPPHRRLDAGQFCRQRKCGHERRLVVADRRHTFDAPSARPVIAE